MAQLTFIIDGQVVENPLNWNQLSLSITRDQNVRILFSELTGTMNFWGNGYQLLWGKRINKCELVEYSVVIDCNGSQYTFTGNIVISDIVFNLDTCVAAAQLIDNNFQARINNNKSIEVDFFFEKTKNFDVIAPLDARQINFAVLSNNFNRQGFLLIDSFQFLVDFMTDKKVEVVSNFLTTDPNKDIIISTGGAIRILEDINFFNFEAGTIVKPITIPRITISFEELFNVMAAKLNLVAAFIGNKLIIEDEAYFNNQPVGVTINEQPGIKFTFNPDEIFASVELGSEPFLENWQCTNGNCNNFQRRYFGFRKESYWFEGNCNIDKNKVLLTTDIVFDTNVIEDILIKGNTDYDENVVIIKTTEGSGPFADVFFPETANPTNGLTAPYYNAYFMNNQVSERNFGGYIPSVEQEVINPQAAFNNSDGLFEVRNVDNTNEFLLTIPQDEPFPWVSLRETAGKFYKFPVNFLNPFLFYDQDNNTYKAQVDGIYRFDIRATALKATTNTSGFGQSAIGLFRLDAEGNDIGFIGSELINVFWSFSTGLSNINHELTVTAFLEKGMSVGVDYLARIGDTPTFPTTLEVRAQRGFPTGDSDRFSFFKCDLVEKDLSYLTQSPATFDNSKPAILEFERPLDFAQVISLAARPEQQIEVTGCGLINQKCVIKSLTIDNFESFNTKFQLMTTIPT